jgi:hypothetical protein
MKLCEGQLSLDLFPVDIAAPEPPEPNARAPESPLGQASSAAEAADVAGILSGSALPTTRGAAEVRHVHPRAGQCLVERSEVSAVRLGTPEARHREVTRDDIAASTGAAENSAVLPSTRAEASGAGGARRHAGATVLLDAPDALLTRTHLRELGLERRAVDAVFRALAVVALPGYSRPMIRVRDYLELIEHCTFRDDQVRPSARAS